MSGEETKISAVLTVEGLRKFQSDMNTAAAAVESTGKRGVAAGRMLGTVARAGFLAAGAAAVVSVKKFASLDDALNRVQINSKATPGQMKAIEKAAMQMGKKFPASATEVAEAMNEMLKAGMSVEDMLSGGLENALAMATAEGLDMATSATAMSQAMAVFAVKGKKANTVTAALSNVASGTSANINDLTSSLAQVGGTASQAGMSVGDTTAALGVLIQNGLDGSKAGTALNSMLLALRAPTDGAAKALKAAGVQVYDATGKMRPFRDVLGNLSKSLRGMSSDQERAAFLQKTFGVDAQQAASILSKQLPLYDRLATATKNVDAPVQKARDQMKSLAMQLDTTGESLGNMAVQVGAAFAPAVLAAIPYVQDFATYVGEGADDVARFVGEAAEGAGSVASFAMSVASAVAPVIGFVTGISGAADAVTQLAGASSGVPWSQMAGGAASGAAAMALIVVGANAARTAIISLTAAAAANPAILIAVVGAAAAGAAIAGVNQGLKDAAADADSATAAVNRLDAAIAALSPEGTKAHAEAQLAAKEATNQHVLAIENLARVKKDDKATDAQVAQATLAVTRAFARKQAAQDALSKSTDAQKGAYSDLVDGYKDGGPAVLKAAADHEKLGIQLEAISTLTGGAPGGFLAEMAAQALHASGKIDGLTDAVDDIPQEKTVTITAQPQGFGNVLATIQQLAQGVTVPVRKGGAGGGGMATGGRVYGAGTGTSDSVPAMLSAGEWVLTAKQARGIGYGTLADIPKFAAGGTWFGNQAQAARASMQSGSAYWKAMERARVTPGLGDDRAATNQQANALKRRLADIRGMKPGGKGDALKQNRQAKADAIRELNDMIRDLQSQSWQITNIGIPGAKGDAAAANLAKQQQANQTARQQAVTAIGGSGTAIGQQQQMAGTTETLDDDLAALRARLAALQKLGTPKESAQRIADTQAEIWTLLNVTAPQQQAQAVQAAINAIGGKGTDMWKRGALAGATETLTDDLAVLQERLAALQAFGPAASAQIADAEADIWTMTNVTMPAQAQAAAAQADAWRNEAAMAMGRGFYGASGGAGGGSSMGITDTSGGDAGGVGHAPRPEIDRVWLAGEQLNDLDARDGGAGVTITMILGWDEAEDFESTRSKRADGDALGGTRDGSVRVVVKGRLTGSTYQDYHARRRALKAIVRAAADQTMLKVPDVTYGDDAGDYDSTYAASGMVGMERRIVRLVSNLKWGDSYGLFGSEFEFELRSPHRFVEADVAAEAPSGDNAAAVDASSAARTSILAIRGEIAAAPAMDSALKFYGTSVESVLAVRAASTDVALDVFTKLSGPSSLPANTGSGAAFDPSGTYLAITNVTTSPYLTIYKRSGDTFTKLSDPASLPAGSGNSAAFDPSGTYLAIAHSTSPYLTIYKRSGDTFTKLSDPATLPAGIGRGVAFDPSGTRLAVAHDASPYVTIYSRSGDTFTKLSDPATLPAGNAFGAAFDPSGTYLAITADTTPYVTIYKRSGDTFTKLTNPSSLPAGIGYSASFDPSGTYLAIGHATSPYVTIYKRSGDVFSKLTNPADLPAQAGAGAAFDPSGTYLSIAHATTPFITIYKRVGDTFTKLTNPASLPAAQGTAVTFDPSGAYMAVAHVTSPYVSIYAASGSDAAFDPLGTITVSPPALAISARTDLLPVASADISSTKPLTSQDSFDIDTIAGTATPVHRTPLARLIGGGSFIAGIIPSRYAGGPTSLEEIVTRSKSAGTAINALGALLLSDTDIANAAVGGSDDHIGVLGALTASPAQVATGMPGWRAKRSAANFTASSYARRKINAALGQPKSQPVIHTMLVKPAASWATATTDLAAFAGAGVNKFAHLLTLETQSGGINYINGVGFFHDGTRLVPTCARYDDQGTDAYRLTYSSGALSITPDPALHVWVCAIIDAGKNVWNAITLVDINTGEPLMYFVEGHDQFDGGATETTGGTFSQVTTTTSSGTRASNVAFPTAATRYIGCGTASAWAGSVAGTTVPAGGMGAIITLDAAAELYDYGITDVTMLTSASTAALYTAISSSIIEWIRERFAPQSIRRAPIALETEWTDRVPELHGEPIVRLDSVPNSTTAQALGASRTGGLSTELMAPTAYEGAMLALTPAAFWRMGDTGTASDGGYDARILTHTPAGFWKLEDAGVASDGGYDAAVMAYTPSLFLKGDDPSGTTLTDSSGNGYNFTMAGGITLGGAGPLEGVTDYAPDYGGVNGKATRTYTAATNPATMSFSCWFMRDVDTGGLEEIYINASANKGFEVLISSSDLLGFLTYNGASAVTSAFTTAITTGVWYHMVGTTDGATSCLYVDGVLVDSDACAFLPALAGTAQISGSGAASYFNGKISRTFVTSTVLTARQVMDLYLAGRPSYKAADASGNALHGALVGSPTLLQAGPLEGVTDYCIDFDGVNDSIVIPYAAALNPATFTLSAWIMRDTDAGATEMIFDSRNSGNLGYALYINSTDKLTCQIGTGATTNTITGATNVPTGVWVHAALRFDGATATLYLNGVYENAGASTLSANATGIVRIGGAYTSGSLWVGKISRLWVDSTVLTAREIMDDYLAGAPSVKAADASGNGHHAAAVGGVTFGVAGAITDDDDTAIDLLAASSQRLVIPYAAALNPAAITISGWASRDSDTGAIETILDCIASNLGYRVTVGATDLLTLTVGTGATTTATAGTTAIGTGSWFHWAITHSGSSAKVYLNGVLENTAATTYGANTSSVLRIGALIALTNYWDGKLDEILLDSSVLTDAQILAIYEAGRYNHASPGAGEAVIEAREVR